MFQHLQFQCQTLLCRTLRQCLVCVRSIIHHYSLAATVEFQSAAEDIVHPKIMANAMPAWFPVSYLSGGSEATA